MTTAVDAEETLSPKVGITILAVILAQLVGVMNTTVVATAIPSILRDLTGTPVEGTWILTIALVGLAVSGPIWARLSDYFSPIVMVRIGLTITMVCGILQSMMDSVLVIILLRFVQAVGIGGILSLSLIIFARVIPPRQRGKYTGWMSTANLVGTMSGPFLGGLIAESTIGWRGAFVLIVPLALTALVLLQFAEKIPAARGGGTRIDFVGAILIVVSVTSILVWLSFAGDLFEFVSPLGLGLIVGGGLCAVLLIVTELRAKAPILPLRALRGRVMLLAIIAATGNGSVIVPTALFMSMYLQNGLEASPSLAGLILICTAAGNVITSFSVGFRSAKTGRLRRYLIGGGVFVVTGALLITRLGPDTPIWMAALVLFTLGLGQGALTQFIVLAAQNAVPISQVGAVSGFTQFSQTLAGATTMSVFGAILGTQLVALQGQGLSTADAYATAIPQLFTGAVVAAGIALIAVALLPPILLRSTIDMKKVDEPAEPAAAAGPASPVEGDLGSTT